MNKVNLMNNDFSNPSDENELPDGSKPDLILNPNSMNEQTEIILPKKRKKRRVKRKRNTDTYRKARIARRNISRPQQQTISIIENQDTNSCILNEEKLVVPAPIALHTFFAPANILPPRLPAQPACIIRTPQFLFTDFFSRSVKTDNQWVQKCNRQRCKCCPLLLFCRDYAFSSVTGRAYPIIAPKPPLSCISADVIYLTTCTKCGKQYVGQTTTLLRDRETVKRNQGQMLQKGCASPLNASGLIQHFYTKNGHCNKSHIRTQPIEKIIALTKEARGKLLNEREDYHILTLRTLEPYGLNRILNKDSERTKHSTTDAAFYSLPRRTGQHGDPGGSRYKDAQDTDFHPKEFFDFHYKYTAKPLWRHMFRVAINGLRKQKQRQLLYWLIHTGEHLYIEPMATDVLAVCRDLLSSRLKFTTLELKREPRKPVKVHWSVDFVNKGIARITLPTLLHDTSLVKLLPQSLKNPEPTVVYTYTSTIRNQILNYKQTVDAIKGTDWNDNTTIINKPCDTCNLTHANAIHNHVQTGDLTIIPNTMLRDLLEFGTGYRDPPPINMHHALESVLKDLPDMITRWALLEGREPSEWNEWQDGITKLVNLQFNKVLPRTHTSNTQSYLQDDRLRIVLQHMHERYVLTETDKATANTSVTCKKWYIHLLVQELLYNEDGTYTEIKNTTVNLIVASICEDLQVLFGIIVENNSMKLAFVYISSKNHKTPPGARFIAASANCATTNLSKIIALCLQAVENMLRRYCRDLERRTGVRHMWIINNTKPVLDEIDKVNHGDGATDMNMQDFKTLYTVIAHIWLKITIAWSINKAFDYVKDKHGGKEPLLAIYNKRASFVFNPQKDTTTVSRETLIEMVNYLIDHIYVTCGDKIFRQTIGIPIGTNAGSFLANLHLFYMEYHWIRRLLEVKDKAKRDENTRYLIKYFNMTFRYIDDLFAGNNNDQMDKHKEAIYGKMEIKREDKTTFLDIHVKIVKNKFVTSIYDKRNDFDFNCIKHTHMSSNTNDASDHQIIKGQLLRFAKNCTNYKDFIKVARAETQHMITHNNMTERRLKRNTNNLITTYPGIMSKYGKDRHKIVLDIFNHNKSASNNLVEFTREEGHVTKDIKDLGTVNTIVEEQNWMEDYQEYDEYLEDNFEG